MEKEQPFGLPNADIKELLSHTLKPEEIAGPAEVQQDRIRELIHWFLRYGRGQANPKWSKAHAFELAYYIATTASNRFIDLNAVREKAFTEGVKLPPAQRKLLLKHIDL